MTDPTLLPLLTALFLLSAFVIFLAQTLMQAKRGEKITRSFNLLMTIFMLAWSLSELFEETSVPPINTFSHYTHFLVMVLFAVAITWRWRWASEEAGLRHK